MKRIILIVPILLFSLLGQNAMAQCDDALINEVAPKLDKYNYLKDYKVWIPKSKKNKLPTIASYNIILNKGKQYRFLMNDAEELDGRLKFELYAEGKGMVLTNYDGVTDSYYSGAEFKCTATSMYTVSISFSGGKEGCGVVIVGFKDPNKSKYDDFFSQ